MLKPNDHKAIAAYARKHEAIPQLSIPPTITFKSKLTGKLTNVDLTTIRQEMEK